MFKENLKVELIKIQRAFISLDDCSHIIKLIEVLEKFNIKVYVTHQVYNYLKDSGVIANVEIVSSSEVNLENFDLLVADLLPFRTFVEGGGNFYKALEMIDMENFNLLRGAARNFTTQVALPSSSLYDTIIKELTEKKGHISREVSFNMALSVFELTSAYDAIVTKYFKMAELDRVNY